MKKLLTLLTMALMVIGANAQAVIAEKDWTGCSKSDLLGGYIGDSDGSIEATADGVAITISKKSAQIWQPQTFVLHEDDVSLDEGGNYMVVITAKIPSDGELWVDLGDLVVNRTQRYIDVNASDDFQEIVIQFNEFPTGISGVYVNIGSGCVVGTTVIKKVEIWDMDHDGIHKIINDCSYYLNMKNKTATLAGLPQDYKGDYIIPQTVSYNGSEYTITRIEGIHCTGLTSVTIPNSVTSIWGFNGCNSLNSVTIPSSVTSIDGFNNCTGLTSVSFPNTVTSISGFDKCVSLTSLTIPSGVTSVSGFNNCTGLASLTIPSTITSIRGFTGCTSLTSVTIPSGVTSVSGFNNCTGLTSLTIPSTVTSISGFTGRTSLTSVTIPSGVTSISGFSGCTSLTSVTLPSSLTSISGFKNCTSLTSFTIPNSVTSISDDAFQNCSGLTSVTIQCIPTSVGRSIFSDCSELKEVIFDCSTVTPLFKGSSIQKITIGESVTRIQERALAGLDKIEDVICLAENVPTTDRTAFENSYIDYATLKVPVGALEAYKTTAPWSGFKQIEAAEGNLPEDAEKCATPTIMFANGTLTFSCQTEGVEYKYKIESPDVKDGTGNDIKVSATYKVSVFAFKSGRKNSDTATLEITASGKPGDANGDGVVNAADVVKTVNIIIGN